MKAYRFLALWNAYMGFMCCRIRSHGPSVLFHDMAHKAQEKYMESGCFGSRGHFCHESVFSLNVKVVFHPFFLAGIVPQNPE